MTKENFFDFCILCWIHFFIHKVANSYIGILFHSQAAFFQPIDNKFKAFLETEVIFFNLVAFDKTREVGRLTQN